MAYWSKQEITTLVNLMRKYGSDFTMIATLMTKTRDQIKRKFKVLEKSNAALADAIFEKNINESTLQAITEHMEIEENDFFSVWAETIRLKLWYFKLITLIHLFIHLSTSSPSKLESEHLWGINT